MNRNRSLALVAFCIGVAGWGVYSKVSKPPAHNNISPQAITIPQKFPHGPATPSTNVLSAIPKHEPTGPKYKYSRAQIKTLKRLGMPEDTDLIGEYLSGKRDRAKFLRTKAFYISVGFTEAQASWKSATVCLDSMRVDPDSEEWRNRVRKENEITDPALAKKFEPLSDSEVAKLGTTTPQSNALRALLRPDNAGNTLAEQLAALLPDERFMESPEGLAKITQLGPDSAWGPVLAAKAAMERGDWAEAERLTRNFLDKKMEPAYLGLRDELTRFLMTERNCSYEEASRWVIDGLDRDSLARHALDLATTYHQQAKKMKEEGNPAWEALAANGLALAEAGTPIHTEDGLHYQHGLLNLLGKDLAQKYLSEPFDQVVAEITQIIPQARAESLQVWKLLRTLEPSQRIEFNFLLQTQGTTAALKQFAQH
jgi:hypothetical protein